MIIKEFKKKKNNEYELIFNNNQTIYLYDDIILKYQLLINKEITSNELKKIIKENDRLEAYYKAVKYLNIKMRSILEVKKYLSKLKYDLKIIDSTIKKLIEENYLNDLKFTESYINDQYNLTNNGPGKIKYNLIKLGIEEKNIIIDKDFNEKINHLISKKINTNRKLSTNALRNNIINYLISLGYPKEDFIDKLENINNNDASFIKKDYDRLLTKYKNKYDNVKLKLVLKDKLYQKGYQIEDINDIIN